MEDIVIRIAHTLPGFLLAIVCHEAAHAYVASRFGDQTARLQGRLTLNPAVHYDLVGTVIFPIIGLMMGAVPFGWAKPVPVDPRNFKSVKHGIFWVSFAGPLANIILALVSGLFMAILHTKINSGFYFYNELYQMLNYSVLINIILAVFNLIPFPPLDGSKMVSTFLNYEQARKYEELQRYSFVFILILWFTPVFSYMVRPVLFIGNGIITLFIRLLG